MGDFRLHVSEEDIVDKLQLADAMKDHEKKAFLAEIKHNLVSRLSGITMLRDDHLAACMTDEQREIVEDIHDLARNYITHTVNLIDSETRKQTQIGAIGIRISSPYTQDQMKKDIDVLLHLRESVSSSAYVYLLINTYAARRLPLIGRLPEPISEDLARLSQSVDDAFLEYFYSTNLMFSKPSARLDKAVGTFLDTEVSICGHEGITLSASRIYPISTLGGIDYMTAVSQMVFNAKDHAFVPERDIHGRTKQGFQKMIEIYGEPKDSTATKGVYIIGVRDNGFGMTDEVRDGILAGNGVSTKPANGVTHGIGMQDVKAIAEKGGGQLRLETELGRGTDLSIAIPYERIEAGVCYQD
jgi:signal transduction histidine kinase